MIEDLFYNVTLVDWIILLMFVLTWYELFRLKNVVRNMKELKINQEGNNNG